MVLGLILSTVASVIEMHILLRPVRALRELSSGALPPKILKTGIKEFDEVANALARSFALLNEREKHQKLLVDELNHRGRNMLTAIQAIAYQTRKQSKSLAQFGSVFEGRLNAMARSYSLLTRNDWRGGSLQDVILDCRKSFASPDRIRVSGPKVELLPKALIGIGMVVHELATNATKYGALSNQTGYVTVTWNVESDKSNPTVQFKWSESGGPAQLATSQPGFGTRLIASVIEGDLQGKVDARIENDGLRLVAIFPLHSFSEYSSEMIVT